MAFPEGQNPINQGVKLFGDRPWYQDPDPTSFPLSYNDGHALFNNPKELAETLHDVAFDNHLFYSTMPLIEMYVGIEGNKITPANNPLLLTGLQDVKAFRAYLGLGVHDVM